MSEIEKLENLATEEGFWDDMEKSQKILQRTKEYKNKVQRYDDLVSLYDDTLVLAEMMAEEGETEADGEMMASLKQIKDTVETMTLETLLSGEYDKNNAILTIHAGAGGTEAQDWAQMLLRMFTRWAERNQYTLETVDFLPGDEAGVKSVTIIISGLNAYGYLKSEKGVHRLVRISPFDSSGRRHTSFASVEVMPEIDDDTEIKINTEDIRVDTFRASGAG